MTLRLRLVAMFALVALVAAVSVSGISYWLTRNAVLTRTQNAALNDFRKSMEEEAGQLPRDYTCAQLREAAGGIAETTQNYAVLLLGSGSGGGDCVERSEPEFFDAEDIPPSLREAVERERPDGARYHLYWQRVVRDGEPYLVGGAKLIGEDPTPSGYLWKPLVAEREDLESLLWSLAVATGLALLGAMLLAQAASSTVLRPVRRLGAAARELGEGRLDTRLRVSGSDELADLSREFNRTAALLEERVEELSAREKTSRRFVADMSHELRTPLTALSAVTEVLEEEQDGLDPMIAQAVGIVVSETRRLGNLVENLMEVTRFDARTARLVLDDVDVADQITACLDARAWLDAVELDAERGIVVRLDPRRLDVVLANLIGNALKHGGSPVRVSVREEPGAGGTELVIRVHDRGPGIPEEFLPHVFDRFRKASASRPRSDGSGLGLSIAQANAHIHGGDITAENAPEGGALFTLRLPEVPPSAEECEGDAEDTGNATGDGRRPRRGDGDQDGGAP